MVRMNPPTPSSFELCYKFLAYSSPVFVIVSVLSIFWFWTGTTDGQTKVVREGDNGVAYGWNMGEQKWDKVIPFVLYNF